jgi:hypothetical protein
MGGNMKYRFHAIVLLLAVAIIFLVQVSDAAVVVAADDSRASTKLHANYVCDGIDDQAEIQAALNAAGYGGVVQLTEGTFKTTGAIKPPAGVTLLGMGPEKTTLSMEGFGKIYSELYGADVQYNAGIYVHNEYTTLKGFTITRYGWIYTSASHFKAEDVWVVDSHQSPQPGDWRIGSYAAFMINLENKDLTDFEYLRCKAVRVGANGFKNDNRDDPAQGVGHPQYTLSDVRYIDCEAIECGSGAYPDNNQGSRANEIYACGFDVQEYVIINGMLLKNCYAYNNWMDGFHCESRDAYNIQFENCVAERNGHRKVAEWGSTGFGAGFVGGRNAYYLDCYSKDNVNDGFQQDSVWNTVLENCVDESSPDGFSLSGGSRRYWENNVYKNCRSIDAKRYGFMITPSTQLTNIRLENCVVENAGRDGIYLNEVETLINDSFIEIIAKGVSGSHSQGVIIDKCSIKITNGYAGIMVDQNVSQMVLVEDTVIQSSTSSMLEYGINNEGLKHVKVKNVSVIGAKIDFYRCEILTNYSVTYSAPIKPFSILNWFEGIIKNFLIFIY